MKIKPSAMPWLRPLLWTLLPTLAGAQVRILGTVELEGATDHSGTTVLLAPPGEALVPAGSDLMVVVPLLAVLGLVLVRRRSNRLLPLMALGAAAVVFAAMQTVSGTAGNYSFSGNFVAGTYQLGFVHAGYPPHYTEVQVQGSGDVFAPLVTLHPLSTPTPTATATATATPPPPAGMVLVPAGSFNMGCNSTQGDYDCSLDEAPVHLVSLGAYFIDTYEVTAAQYKACVDAGGSGCSAAGTGGHCTYEAVGMENHPVNCVNWSQANSYCTWAGKRLPTEAEWEKAARGTNERIFTWGNTTPNCTNANFRDCVGSTSAVGSHPAGISPHGAYDMAGNVWEWVHDWFGAAYYSVSPPSNPEGPATGSYRVLRGGSWASLDASLRGSGRSAGILTVSHDDTGFRCAQTP